MMYAQALLVRAQSRGIDMPVAFTDMHVCRGKRPSIRFT
jgi:hypothetical protein